MARTQLHTKLSLHSLFQLPSLKGGPVNYKCFSWDKITHGDAYGQWIEVYIERCQN